MSPTAGEDKFIATENYVMPRHTNSHEVGSPEDFHDKALKERFLSKTDVVVLPMV